MGKTEKWTDEEIEQLKKMYLKEKRPYKEIAEILGRRWTAVRAKVRSLGIQRDKVYHSEHKCAVCGDTESSRYYRWNHEGPLEGKMLCGKHYSEMLKNGKIIDDTVSKHIVPHDWTDDEKATLEECYAKKMTISEIEKVLTRHSAGAISCMAEE